MRALVTGGAGFIGSHLTDALAARGDEVAVLDDLSTGKTENLALALEAGAHLEVADVTDRDAVLSFVDSFEPEVIFHLAAQIDVRVSVADPAFDARVNVSGTANLLEGARRAGSRRFLLASTGGVIYGEGDGRNLPLGEESAALPMCPYGQSKLAAEGYLGLYNRLYGLDGASLRLGNVYGPRQDPHGEAGVVAIFCGKLAEGERPVVFGTGRQTRDYIFVDDVVKAWLAAAASPGTGSFNIGTGREVSVLDLIAALNSATGSEGQEPRFEAPRDGEVERISIDPGRAGELFGWQAETALDRGLGVTFEALTATSPGI